MQQNRACKVYYKHEIIARVIYELFSKIIILILFILNFWLFQAHSMGDRTRFCKTDQHAKKGR